jgi:seryl-tRNA synthetase
LIALDTYGNTQFGAALHVANAFTVFFLLQHLSQPKQAPRNLYVLKVEFDEVLTSNKERQALLDTQARMLEAKQKELDAHAKAEQERVSYVQRLQNEKAALQKQLTEFKPTDEMIVEALSSGEWSLARIAEDVAVYTGSQNQAALKLGTSPQNLSNWINKKG